MIEFCKLQLNIQMAGNLQYQTKWSPEKMLNLVYFLIMNSMAGKLQYNEAEKKLFKKEVE